MWVTANVKWYINGNERGVYTPTPTLKTWAEIQAYTDASALLTELNTYPTEYYNMINEEWYMADDPCGPSGVSYMMDNSRWNWIKIVNKFRFYTFSNSIWDNRDSAPCPS